MSDATTKIYTLHDLAKIALGAPELTNEHLSVLQSLLIILLQKLNCHNETVRIQGFPAKCMEKLLKETSSSCQYDFQWRTIKGFQEKYVLLEQLERKTKDIELKLNEHFQQIRNSHKTNKYHAPLWDFYAASNEDLCTLYMKHNKEFCLLTRNMVFNNQLRVRMSNFMVERLMEFEAKIEGMQNKIKETTELANKAAGKQKCIEYIVKDIEDMRRSLNNNRDNFPKAMLETQEMLDCKLDRVTLPALKKFLDHRFDHIKEHLKILKKESTISNSNKPLAIENKKICLSCARPNKLELTKQFQPIKSSDDATNKCLCTNILKEPTILKKMEGMKRNAGKLLASTSTFTLSGKRFSRQSAELKNQLKLEGHGILTNYSSFATFTKPDLSALPVIKSTIKKQKKQEKSHSIGRENSKITVTNLYTESTVNMQRISKQSTKSRSIRLSSIYTFGN